MKIKETEHRIIKHFAKEAFISIAIFIVAVIAIGLIYGKKYTDKIDLFLDESAVAEDFDLSFDESGIVNVIDTDFEEGNLIVELEGLSHGTVVMDIVSKSTGEIMSSCGYRVDYLGVIHNMNNGNYSKWQAACAAVTLLVAVIAFFLWEAYVKAHRKLMYSYLCIFFAGFAVWVTAMSALMLSTVLSSDSVFHFYAVIKGSGIRFMFITLPFCLIFAVCLICSNISLIRHEGFGIVNVLGIGLSVALIIGEALAIIVYAMPFAGSMTTYKIIESFLSVYTTVFVILECFLIGSILCGITAAVHMPRGAVDYIIILGCAVRPDGTLYPLIKGRVDKALELRSRIIASGHKAPFMIPSGGKGPDEGLSEGEAMANYMREQGVPDNEILTENKSTDTDENLKFSYAIISKHLSLEDVTSADTKAFNNVKVAFATTNYHVFRSGYLSRKLGLLPEGIGSKTKLYFWPNASVRELIGMLVYMKITLLLLFAPIALYFVALNIFLPL
ncbi:MAG: YdcF family protein [Clostridia bacterium]|nr:YdcF family protein [Clostridia bacterium]